MALPTQQYRDEIVMLLAAAVGENMTTREIFDRLYREWEVPFAETLWTLERLEGEQRIIKLRIDNQTLWTYPRILPPHQDIPSLN